MNYRSHKSPGRAGWESRASFFHPARLEPRQHGRCEFFRRPFQLSDPTIFWGAALESGGDAGTARICPRVTFPARLCLPNHGIRARKNAPKVTTVTPRPQKPHPPVFWSWDGMCWWLPRRDCPRGVPGAPQDPAGSAELDPCSLGDENSWLFLSQPGSHPCFSGSVTHGSSHRQSRPDPGGSGAGMGSGECAENLMGAGLGWVCWPGEGEERREPSKGSRGCSRRGGPVACIPARMCLASPGISRSFIRCPRAPRTPSCSRVSRTSPGGSCWNRRGFDCRQKEGAA